MGYRAKTIKEYSMDESRFQPTMFAICIILIIIAKYVGDTREFIYSFVPLGLWGIVILVTAITER